MRSIRILLAIAAFTVGTLPCAWADDTTPLETLPPTQSVVPANHPALLGSASCAATACHGGERHVLVPDQRSGGEYEIWRSRDPHAAAHQILNSPKFAQIVVRLKIAKPTNQRTTGKNEVAKYAVLDQAKLQECMNCHNPSQVTSVWSDQAEVNLQSEAGFAIECETCHGPAQHWITTHAHRDWDRRQASLMGFQDMKHYLQRAKLCADCHVGNGDRDMNHDMIAAGHPPLRFELASYMAKLPKHWNDEKERTLVPDRELQLWITGQLANFDNSLALLESRVLRAEGVANKSSTRPHAPWPEFAEYSCTACHQKLTAASEWKRERKTSSPEDVTLRWTNWNHGFLETVLPQASMGDELSRERMREGWQAIRQSMERHLTDDPEKLTALATDIHAWRGPLTTSWTSSLHELHGPVNERDVSVYTLLLPRTLPSFLAWKQHDMQHFTHDQALQAYGLLVATAQARYDQSVVSRESVTVSPEVLVALRQMKLQLVPLPNRPFGAQVDSRQSEFKQRLIETARLLEGAPAP